MRNYLDVNLANWNSRVPHHVIGYDLDAFRADPHHISRVVRFDRARLGNITGLDVLHLQCHIGTDTLSLHRLGARSVVGLDFSQPALEVAKELAASSGANVELVCSDVYGAPAALSGRTFDLVYTGVGALCWLPDIARWARVVAELLRPGGILFVRDGHPMLNTLSPTRTDGLLVVEHPYFEDHAGTRTTDSSTYVEHESPLAAPESISFNHGIGEILTAVADAGMRLRSFEEHRSVPWNRLGAAMVETDGEYQLREMPERLAASFTLRAER
ncbi:MAG: hypothetical protein JWP97_1397 [Labilithrix sp.]|nr:hypothetical protein [Labilithrix sp.]